MHTERLLIELRYLDGAKVSPNYDDLNDDYFFDVEDAEEVKAELEELLKGIDLSTSNDVGLTISKGTKYRFNLHGYPHCCGLLVMSGIQNMDETTSYDSIVKKGIELAEYMEYPVLQYLVTQHQKDIYNALIKGGFKEISTFKNSRTGSQLKILQISIGDK